jgi:outer membrane protein assembly factor BamB
MKLVISALSLLLCLFAWSLSATAAPSMTISPSSGPPRTLVTAKFSGFPANRVVDVYFDLNVACSAVSDSLGKGSCSFRIETYMGNPYENWVTAYVRYVGIGARKLFMKYTNWPQFHGGPGHAGNNTLEYDLNSTAASLLDLAWRAKPVANASATGSPTVYNGRVYIRDSNHGKLYAFNARTGALSPGFPVNAGANALDIDAPAVANNIVYAVGDVGGLPKLMAYNASTGASIAGFPQTLSALASAAPLVYGGNVFVPTVDGKIFAFNAKTGVPLYGGTPITLAAGKRISTPVILDGVIYAGSADGFIHARYLSTPANSPTNYPFNAAGIVYSISMSGNILCFGTSVIGGIGKLYCLDARHGVVLPGFPFAPSSGEQIVGAPAIARGYVYWGNSAGLVGSVSLATGLPRSSPFSVGEPVMSSPVVISQTSLVMFTTQTPDLRGRLFVGSADSPALQFYIVAHPTYGYGSVAVADGKIYVPTYNAKPGIDQGLMGVYSAYGESVPNAALAGPPRAADLRPYWMAHPQAR